jgi:hypothetical protein
MDIPKIMRANKIPLDKRTQANKAINIERK